METIGSRIREARDQANLSVRALAERLPEIGYSSLSRIETGQRKVASHELFDIAEALGVTTGHLLGTSSRSRALAVAGRLGAEAHPDYLDYAVSRVTQVIEMDDLLERVVGPAPTAPRPELNVSKSGSALAQGRKLAAAAREVLGLGFAPVLDLRGLLEERVGAHVMAQPIAGAVHGICVSDGTVAVVLINSSDRWTRQNYTMAHELGHLLCGDLELYEVTSEASRDDTAERRAEAFAAHFLAPDEGIRDFVGARTVDAALVGELMSYFGVSFEAMCWRLLNVGLISEVQRSTLAARGAWHAVAAAALVDEFAAHEKRLEGTSRPPQRLLRRAISAYADGEIGVGVVAAIVGENDLSSVRKRLAEAGINPEEGTMEIDAGDVSASIAELV